MKLSVYFRKRSNSYNRRLSAFEEDFFDFSNRGLSVFLVINDLFKKIVARTVTYAISTSHYFSQEMTTWDLQALTDQRDLHHIYKMLTPNCRYSCLLFWFYIQYLSYILVLWSTRTDTCIICMYIDIYM